MERETEREAARREALRREALREAVLSGEITMEEAAPHLLGHLAPDVVHLVKEIIPDPEMELEIEP